MHVCSTYVDKCAKLKDHMLQHLDDLNHFGMMDLWLQQLKEPMTEFVAVAYDIHSPVNKQELRVKVITPYGWKEPHAGLCTAEVGRNYPAYS